MKKKLDTANKSDAMNLVVAFATLAEDTLAFAQTLQDPEYKAFVERIAANIQLYGERFHAFTKAAGMISE